MLIIGTGAWGEESTCTRTHSLATILVSGLEKLNTIAGLYYVPSVETLGSLVEPFCSWITTAGLSCLRPCL